MDRYASRVLRIGTALVFIWFGFEQLTNVNEWTGWLPSYTSGFPISATTLVYINGAFETIFGLLLLVGLYTKLSASLLALHMAHIISVVGYGEIGVRDFAIFVAVLSVALSSSHDFSLDTFFSRRKTEQVQ
ncbi:MAG: DoxX family protein [Patescibacteria group bacterium]